MLPESAYPYRERLNILVLYDQTSVHTKTTGDHLASFRAFSHHNVYYLNATNEARLRIDLNLFDAIIIHYSVRLAFTWHLSSYFADALARCRRLKLLFIQDEYDNTWIASDWIKRLGINVVFTNVPPQYLQRIYSRLDHSKVEFVQTLTGYAPLHLKRCPTRLPFSQRPVAIGYRVRQLPFRYGKLAWEKFYIGQRMRAVCEERGLKHDIEWSDAKRIYGDRWLDFIASCRATLGAETGSNVFDFDGKLTPAINRYLRAHPGISFDDFFEQFLKPHETEEIMNHISPRAFEAIALRTALILFEGRYCGILQPDTHYLMLKKDFSNIDEVLAKLQDDNFLEAMTERAYQDVVGSGRWTYERLVRDTMAVIEARVPESLGNDFAARMRGAQLASGTFVRFEQSQLYDRPIDADKMFPQARRSIPARAIRKAWRITKRVSYATARGIAFLFTRLGRRSATKPLARPAAPDLPLGCAPAAHQEQRRHVA